VAVGRRSDELAVAGTGESVRGRAGSEAERGGFFFFFTACAYVLRAIAWVQGIGTRTVGSVAPRAAATSSG